MSMIRLVLILGLVVLAGCHSPSTEVTFKKSPFPNRGVLVKAQSADTAAPVYCAGATGHVLVGAGPTYVDCGVAPPPVCTPPATWNGTACVPPTPTGIDHCAADQKSTVFSNGTTLPRQCTGNVTFYHNYHAPYPGPALYRLDVALADALHPGPFSNIISGYTMLLPVAAGSYVSLAFNMAISGQAQFTSDPSGGPAGMISISRRPGVFAVGDPDLVVSPVYGPCVYSYGASNSLWMGVGADCPLVIGTDYYLNFAPIQSDGSPWPDYTGILSYSEVAGH